jgi:hypothetical protein
MQVIQNILSYTSCTRISVADIWLHFSATTIPLYSTYSIGDHQSVKPSIALDHSQCDKTRGFTSTCILNGLRPSLAVDDTGNKVASNASDAYHVLTFGSDGSDLTTVIVPATSFPSSMSFNSTSYGIGTTCKHVNYTKTQHKIELTPIEGSVLPNQTWSFYPTGDIFRSSAVYNVRDPHGNVGPPLDYARGFNASNPFGLVLFIQWPAIFWSQDRYGLNEHFGMTAWSGACNISVYDVTLSYKSGTYSLTNRTISSQNTTTTLFMPFSQPRIEGGNYFESYFFPRLVLNLAPQLNNIDANFLVEVARQISQLGMALDAGVVKPTQTLSDVTMTKEFLATRYPMNALLMLWASTVFYLILGVGLLARAAYEQEDTSSIEPLVKSSTLDSTEDSPPTTSVLALAQQWVTSPSAIIAQHFVLDETRSSNTIVATVQNQKNVIDMFGDETGTDRLGIGFRNGRLNNGLRCRHFCIEYQDRLEEIVGE